MQTKNNITYQQTIQSLNPISFDDIIWGNKMYAPNYYHNKTMNKTLDRGKAVLNDENSLFIYIAKYGDMHKFKLLHAYTHIPPEFLLHSEINIIDYGCGQALGTIYYADFLNKTKKQQKIKNVTLIEPSSICIDRAELHTKLFLPNSKIIKINSTFDNLAPTDIVCEQSIPTLHILSNVLDMDNFNLQYFANLIKNRLKGINLFVCVSPYFKNCIKDYRFSAFKSLIGGDVIYSNAFNSYKLFKEKSWTLNIKLFTVTIP